MSQNDAYQDPYLIAGTRCLKNRLGIAEPKQLDAAINRITLATGARALSQIRTKDGPWTPADWQAIHKTIFSPIFDWAGEIRTTELSRDGNQFCPSGMLSMVLERRFAEIREDLGSGSFSGDAAVSRLAHHFQRLNEVHPFREGNGRSQKILMSGIAMSAGLSLRWSRVPGGKEAFYKASDEAYLQESGKPLEPLIAAALGRVMERKRSGFER